MEQDSISKQCYTHGRVGVWGGGRDNPGLKGADKKQNTCVNMQTDVKIECKYMQVFADKQLTY